MEIKIVPDDVKALNVDHLIDLSLGKGDWYHTLSEYRLYAYLSTLFNNTTILDIGTNAGNSALALSYNPKNWVRSYDVVEKGASTITQRPNISWCIGNFMEDKNITWANVSMIIIDIDHNGPEERLIMSWLRNIKWKGILIHDDIYLPNLISMWAEIPEEKYDVSSFAHGSGTGLVNFGGIHHITIE